MGEDTGFTVRWAVLRAPTVTIGGIEVPLAARPRAVLLSLLLEANADVSIDRLIDRLWGGDEAPQTARNSVARFVADLRRALGDHHGRIVSAPGSYRVVVHPGERDIDRVEAVLAATSRRQVDDLAESVASLRGALDLIGMTSNPLLLQLSGSVGVERSHDELRIAVIEALVSARQRLGEQGELIALLEQAVELHPYHEALWHGLMTSLNASGRPAEALRAGQRLRALLKEVGLLPSESIRRAERDILGRMQGVRDEAEATPVDDRIASSPRITDPSNRFVGRIDDLKDIYRALQSSRLVSLVGIGGVGKTRLALATIRATKATGTPVYEVGLRSFDDPAMVLPAVGAALGLPPHASRDVDSLARALAPGPFLLVLDNCEHLSESCAELVSALLSGAPGARMLLTSRLPIRVNGERVIPVLPLPTDAAGESSGRSSAAQLFVERAGGLLGTDGNGHEGSELVDEICALLAGHPLAIEVAAAQLAFTSLEQLADQIRVSFEREDVDEPSVDALTGMLDWTWGRLHPQQQTLLARLSVFSSGWTDELATAVVGTSAAPEENLDELIDMCLVVRSRTAQGARFEIVAAAREHAALRLAQRYETEPMLDRLAAAMLEVTGRWNTIEHNALAAASEALLPEHGNVTTALGHLHRCGRFDELAELALNLMGLWTNHRYPDEILRWMEPLIEHPDVSDRLRSGCAASAAIGHHTIGNLDRIAHCGTRAIDLAAGAPHEWMSGTAGYLAIWSVVGETPLTSEQYSAMSFDFAERSAVPNDALAIAEMYCAQLAFIARQYEAALDFYERSRSRLQGPGRVLMLVETGAALSMYMTGRRSDAAAAVDNWVSRSDTDHWHYIVDVVRAIIIGGAGEPERATAQLAEAVRRLPSALVWGQADIVQTAFALLADHRGEHDLADELLATAANRDFQLIAFTVEHLLERRGLSGDDEWMSVAAELWTRVVPADARADRARSTANLVAWWRGDIVGAA